MKETPLRIVSIAAMGLLLAGCEAPNIHPLRALLGAACEANEWSCEGEFD